MRSQHHRAPTPPCDQLSPDSPLYIPMPRFHIRDDSGCDAALQLMVGRRAMSAVWRWKTKGEVMLPDLLNILVACADNRTSGGRRENGSQVTPCSHAMCYSKSLGRVRGLSGRESPGSLRDTGKCCCTLQCWYVSGAVGHKCSNSVLTLFQGS